MESYKPFGRGACCNKRQSFIKIWQNAKEVPGHAEKMPGNRLKMIFGILIMGEYFDYFYGGTDNGFME